jgi:hypothetical protein
MKGKKNEDDVFDTLHFTPYTLRFTRKGAKGLDGGYEDQVACRGSVTT